MSVIDVAVFAVGWTIGWLLLWRGRPLPAVGPGSPAPSLPIAAFTPIPRRGIAVVVPARNEADALSVLIPAIRTQLRDGDELVVVDDHSSDATAAIAAGCG